MHIEYSVPVAKCNYTIKCMPLSNKRQVISNIKIEMFPHTNYMTGTDGLSNVQIYGANNESHDIFNFHIEGDAVTGLSYYEETADSVSSMIFKHSHGLNMPGPQIISWYESIDSQNATTDYEKALLFMHRLHDSFEYKTLVTNINTSAEEAFTLGYGVCQDYAHIFISLMHLAHIPARYVTGLLIGEGASHAWVEILYDDKWIGLDPTNDCVVSENHIKIGIGRDAKDCMINRGIMHGGGTQTQSVRVVVAEQ